ncbi:hypothetical protein JJL56_24730 [Azospirillum sp. YIM DDC1]|uniref:Uncharacterized protein n=1 Tax=Azospirillum aestuarii TaxID=2802052 RepID=A0ABS1I4S3_9PROT|nr:hypothetical protein [Azospirillum aestuarii]MBK4722064.1 hypothetical protein [Azospirillum aestuarii]
MPRLLPHPDDDALPPRRAWDDDDAAEDVDWRPRVDEEPAPAPLSGGTPPLVAAVAAATAALVRLDERLARSPPALRAGWQARCCFLLIIFFEKSERQRHCFLNTKATLSLRNQWFNQCFFKESF